MIFSLIKSISCLVFFLLLWISKPVRDTAIEYFNRLEKLLTGYRLPVITGTLAVYIIITLFLQYHHESHGDEAQAWLIARDSKSLKQMYSLMGYEGSPALWHTLLFPLAQSGTGYWSIFVLNQAFALIATAIWLFAAPFPLALRILLPFSYIFLWEYPIIARSYALSTCLLFAGLFLYQRFHQKWPLWAGLFFLLANTNIHSALLCGGFALYLFLNRVGKKDKTDGKALLVVLAGIATAALQVLPPEDLATYLSGFKFYGGYINFITGSIVAWLGSLSWIIYLMLLLQTARALKNRHLVLVLLSVQTVLFLLFLFKYTGMPRHHFFLFLGMIMVLWFSNNGNDMDAVTKLFLFYIQLLLATSGFVLAYREWKYSFSNGKEAAMYLKAKGYQGPDTFIAAYPDLQGSTLLPYLPNTSFYFPQSGRWGTYIIWNRQRLLSIADSGRVQQASLLPALHPGFKNYFYLTTDSLPADSVQYYRIVPEAHFIGRYYKTFTRLREKYYLYRLPLPAVPLSAKPLQAGKE